MIVLLLPLKEVITNQSNDKCHLQEDCGTFSCGLFFSLIMMFDYQITSTLTLNDFGDLL